MGSDGGLQPPLLVPGQHHWSSGHQVSAVRAQALGWGRHPVGPVTLGPHGLLPPLKGPVVGESCRAILGGPLRREQATGVGGSQDRTQKEAYGHDGPWGPQPSLLRPQSSCSSDRVWEDLLQTRGGGGVGGESHVWGCGAASSLRGNVCIYSVIYANRIEVHMFAGFMFIPFSVAKYILFLSCRQHAHVHPRGSCVRRTCVILSMFLSIISLTHGT